jgi:beta-glucosidase
MGARDGVTTAQLYPVTRDGQRKQRPIGYKKASLTANASSEVTVESDLRLLADWHDGGWSLPGGSYSHEVGENAESVGVLIRLHVVARQLKNCIASEPLVAEQSWRPDALPLYLAFDDLGADI